MSGIELWWLGQAGFRFRTEDGPMAYIDPFLSPMEGRTWEAPVGPEALAEADYVICTHEHPDHFDQGALKAAEAGGNAHFVLIVPQPIVDQALSLGIPAERVVGVQPGQELRYPGLTVHPVPARHGLAVKDAYNFGEELSGGLVRYLGYVIELGGVRVYHAGDTVAYEGQQATVRALKPDLALLPITGRDRQREQEHDIVGNVDGREAAHLAVDIGARILIPVHWEMFPHNPGYPGEVVRYATEHLPQLSVFVLGRGARFRIET